MNAATVGHRWANKDFGCNNTLTASRSCHSEGRNYFSYGTVFGQWLDLEKNVVAIFEGSTSITSSKYKLHKRLFPDDVHVFPYNDNRGGWYYYDGCDIMGREREFTFKHRCILIDYYVTKIYNSLAAINDDYLRENTTDAEFIICSKFIKKQDKYFADQEARRRAEEIARLKREEEERKEREYMEQVKQEQIDECLERGVEGCRDLWRKHLLDIHTASYRSNEKDNVYYYGGNVLLRMNLNKDKVETSKSIRIPVDTCKKMWRVVSKWHENPSCFKPMEIDTKGSGRYTISSYEDDILTAGCHKIAYIEMERMYNEIINA